MLVSLLPLLPLAAADLSSAFGGLFGPSPPLIPFNTTFAAADGNLYRNTDEWACRVLETKALNSGGGWAGPTCTSVGVAGYPVLMWSGANASIHGYAGGTVGFVNQTDELQETYASAPASPNTNTVFELGTLPVPGNGFWQVQIRGPLEFGLTSVQIRTALNSDAPDFQSVGRRTEPAIVDGALSPFYTTTREWAVYTNYTNFPTLKSPGEVVRQAVIGSTDMAEREVTTPSTLSNLSFAIPPNTSYMALAGLSDGQMTEATLYLTFGSVVRELPLRYGSVFRAPLSLFQLALNPNIQYSAVLAPANNTRPMAFHSATFYTSIWPLPEGYASGGNTAVAYLDYIDGNPAPSPIDPSFVATTQPGPAGNGTSGGPSGHASDSPAGNAGESGAGEEKKSNTGAIIGGAVGGGVGALALAVIAFLVLRRRKRKQRFQKNRQSFIIDETDPGLTPFKETTSTHPSPTSAVPVVPMSDLKPKADLEMEMAKEKEKEMPLSPGPMSAGPSAAQSSMHRGRAMDGDDDVQRLPPMYNPAWNVAHTSDADSPESSPSTASPSTPLEHKDAITSGRFRQV